jgi:hypothetical protein
MEDWITWLISGGGLIFGFVGAACTAILPILVLVGLGVFLVRRGRKSGAARQAAQAWPSTTGTVLSSSVQVRRIGRSRQEIPAVIYQYEVGGRAYQGHVVRAGSQFGEIRIAGEARRTVDRYPPGASVTVYYNPGNPQESALER